MQDDFQEGSNNRVRNHIVFAIIHCMKKKQTLNFRNCNVFVFVLGIVSMHHALSRPLLAGSINTIISYYSHKNSYFA